MTLTEKIRAGQANSPKWQAYKRALAEKRAEKLQVPPDVVEAELLPPATETTSLTLAGRSDGSDGPKGAFVAGHPAGYRRGSVNKLTKAMRLAAVEEMERGGDRANPLLVLLRVMQNPEADLKLQAECADRLAKHLWGVKNSFEIETPDPADEDRIAKTRRMFAVMFAEETDQNAG